jgi:anti-sigma factor RsiW
MSHGEFEELAAGYVLGALEPDDEHAFQRHLGGCAACEANVRELETVAGELAYAAPPVDPPDTLWAGIRREIAPEAARRPRVPAGARAAVIVSSRQDRGVLLVENLPPLRRGRVYELWGVPEGDIARAQKALVFVPLRRQGTQTLEFEVPIQPGTVFAITDEPGPDGSDKPTTEPVLAGAPPTA